MKKLIVMGAGDFARETIWIAERMNQQSNQWDILGYVDDAIDKQGKLIDGYRVLGTIDWLKDCHEDIYVTCAVGKGATREIIWKQINENSHLMPATLIDPSAIIGKGCKIGAGSIICAGTIMAIASRMGFNTIVNLNCTIGHDTILGDFCTVHPGSNISGRVDIGKCSDIGTGTKVIQEKTIGPYTITGAGAVVINDIKESGTYVGVPARKVNLKQT